jgi:hypothetical protein
MDQIYNSSRKRSYPNCPKSRNNSIERILKRVRRDVTAAKLVTQINQTTWAIPQASLVGGRGPARPWEAAST